MLKTLKAGWMLVAGIAGTAIVCPLCGGGAAAVGAQSVRAGVQVADSATVRFHISGMTCGSCPTTARLALKRLPGVYRATVTLDDSVGVVRYDPRKVTPALIAAHLTRLTGFGARVLADSTERTGRRGT